MSGVVTGIGRGSFGKRFLLFNDDVCVGLFNRRDGGAAVSNTTLILSADGQFVHISATGSMACQHLTRFCPSGVVEYVMELLEFRNSHVKTPYLCERFHGGVDSLLVNSTRFVDDISSGWEDIDVVDNQSLGDLSSDAEASIVFDADNNQSAGDRQRKTDELLNSGRQGMSNSIFQGYPAIVYPTTSRFPILFAPEEYLENSSLRSLGVTRCPTTICGDNKSANDAFQALEGEISLLQDAETYPTISNRVVLHEKVDGTSYLLNGPSPAGNPPFVDLNSEDLLLEAWLPGDGKDPDSEGPVLTLKGEYFSLNWTNNEGDPDRCDIHISLVNFKDEGVEVLKSTFESQSYVEKMGTKRATMLHLVNYRDYLESNRGLFARIGLRGYSDGISHQGEETQVKISGDPITLTTSEAKFVAMTEVDASSFSSSSSSSSSSSMCITKIHGVFNDHTMVDLDISTKLVSVITTEGEVLEHDLEACFHSTDHVSGDLLTAMYTKNERKRNGPSPSVVRHVRSILAFYRWANAPAEERTKIVDHGVEVARVAQASALQAHRHLLLHKMRQGKIAHQTAQRSTSILEASLNVSGRDSMLGLTPFSYTGLERGLDNEDQVRRQGFEKSIAPKTVYSVTVPDRAARMHPSYFQSELREIAKNALDQTASFLAKTESLEKRAHLNALM